LQVQRLPMKLFIKRRQFSDCIHFRTLHWAIVIGLRHPNKNTYNVYFNMEPMNMTHMTEIVKKIEIWMNELITCM
jgi:hypothetical protein